MSSNVTLEYSAVHPRERGEHNTVASSGIGYFGSSPRARGTHTDDITLISQDRFIPASAGNTTSSHDPQAVAAVHPRERGEHIRGQQAVRVSIGSSPRARGTQGQLPEGHAQWRFIPASAGNTGRSARQVGQ